jgi:hypothetical protein
VLESWFPLEILVLLAALVGAPFCAAAPGCVGHHDAHKRSAKIAGQPSVDELESVAELGESECKTRSLRTLRVLDAAGVCGSHDLPRLRAAPPAALWRSVPHAPGLTARRCASPSQGPPASV